MLMHDSRWIIRLAVTVVFAMLSSLTSAEDSRRTAPAKTEKTFDNSIAPLLARRCLACHSGAEAKGRLDLTRKTSALKGGESGPAIVPGNLKLSQLWQRVTNGEMPPKKPLPEAERRVLQRWITAGANWGTDPIDSFRFTTDARAGYDWWSLQPIKPPAVPMIDSSLRTTHQTLRNPIDAFILRKLKENRLSPSPEADRRTLIRRLSFDLLGLPPSPDEVAVFLNDRSPDAYEQLVDRMLASPQYGERWARHWLDVARFGESQGFERDKLRTNAWRYRDWVVNAFNADMPYDRFARMQIAGDALQPGNANAVIATGFLVAGPYDEVGQSQQSAAMKAVVRQDELEDYVSTVGQAFLGLTVHCARCHDHKFDPIRQREYYRLTASLAGVRHGTRSVGNLPNRREADGRKAALAGHIAALTFRLQQQDDALRSTILAERKRTPQKSIQPPRPIAAWDFRKSLNATTGSHDVKLHGKASRDTAGLTLDGKTAFAASASLKSELKAKTLEAWVRLDNLSQRGGGVISVQTLDGNVFDAIVFGEREPQRWMAGSNGFVRTQSFHATAEPTADRNSVHLAIVYEADGTIRGYRNGRPYGKSYRSSGPATFAAGKSQIVFGLRHSPAGAGKMLSGIIERAQLYDRALSAREIAASAGVSADVVTDEDITKQLSAEQRRERERVRFEIDQLQSQSTRWGDFGSYAVKPASPGETHLLKRGNPAEKAEAVYPGGVAAVSGVRADFDLPQDGSDADRRAKLAAWITDAKNPLFARVIVNRLWHYHFGRGLVNTPSDFGFNGARPSHPELLDWLAAELTGESRKRKAESGTGGWSLKQIQRLIVTSATYRQSSRLPKPQSATPNPQSLDAGNRLLWRMSPRRLEAEAVRDAMLTVSGELNPSVGGPGFYDFTTFTSNSQFYEMRDPVGRTFQRRSLYRTSVRSGRSSLLDTFDCPDPSTKAPKRAVTITPLQALALLNNSFVLRLSDRFAARVQRDAGDNVTKQIERTWQLAYGRPPDDEERRRTEAFVKTHGLPALCRVVFNSSEFLFAD